MNKVAMAPENEAALLRRWTRSGDAAAFSEITRLYAGMVYGTCWRITEDKEAAADATQETFFQLLKQAAGITGSLAGWLHQVATRRAIDLVRREAARRRREQAYAAAPRQTDQWADVSPLVDEAMDELPAPTRDLLVRHFLEGQTMTQLATAQGVSQPTVSRRMEQALEALRERLRAKGLLVGGAVLAALLPNGVTSAPAMVMHELGKMALTAGGTGAGSATAVTLTGAKLTAAIGVAVTIVGIGGWLAYREHRAAVAPAPPVAANPAFSAPATPLAQTPPTAPRVSTPPPRATPAANTPATVGSVSRRGGAPRQGFSVVATPSGGEDSNTSPQSLGFGGFGPVGSGEEPAPSLATPEGTLRRFVRALSQRDWDQLQSCVIAETAEAKGLRRLLEQPQSDEERSFKECLESLGWPVEVVETTPTEEGLKLRWRATVSKPFSLAEEGTLRSWQPGERFELEVRLKRVGEQWRIVGF